MLRRAWQVSRERLVLQRASSRDWRIHLLYPRSIWPAARTNVPLETPGTALLARLLLTLGE